MPIYIPSDHPTFALKNKMNELCKEFFVQLGFSYFQYMRCFNNGSMSLLTNDTHLIEHFQYIENEPVIFSSFEEEQKHEHAYWFLWDDTLPKEPVQLAREKYNIRNGITFVRRSKDYYDMIAVALPIEIDNVSLFYLNKIKAIEFFINAFDDNNKELIDFISENPIFLPKPYRDINHENICLTQGKIHVYGKNDISYITTQELECLRLLLLGNTQKKIAKRLLVSPRTVETYMQRVKQRTGFSTFSEIEQMMAYGIAPNDSVNTKLKS